MIACLPPASMIAVTLLVFAILMRLATAGVGSRVDHGGAGPAAHVVDPRRAGGVRRGVAFARIHAAARAGGGDLAGLVQAFPRAVWAEGRNIAEDKVVKDILAAKLKRTRAWLA